MYNFLVTAQLGAWDGIGYEYPISRFLEFTSENIATRFQEIGSKQLEALKRMPCLFAYEGKQHPLRVGSLTTVKRRGQVLYIEWIFEPDVTPLSFNQISQVQAALDIRDWELSRTHWAIKDEDLAEVLTRHRLISPSHQTPKVEKEALPPPSEPTLRAHSVGQFVETVLGQIVDGKETFFRGHSLKDKYRLEPSLFRKDDKGNLIYLNSEDRLYRELLVSNAPDFEGDVYTLDRLVRMQHYSLPTRLLDITSNPLIALYFACKTPSHWSEDGEVVLLSMNPAAIKYFDSDTASCIANLARLEMASKDKINVSGTNRGAFNKLKPVKRLLHYIREEKPFFEANMAPTDLGSVICVKGKRTNSRISFQSGAFLLFGHDAVLDESGTEQIEVKRIAVTNKTEVLKQLDRLNINESTVFPYIENSARYIAGKFGSQIT